MPAVFASWPTRLRRARTAATISRSDRRLQSARLLEPPVALRHFVRRSVRRTRAPVAWASGALCFRDPRDEGGRFGTLAEEVRQATAQRCLSDPRLTTEDLAERTGFVTVPAFHRACMRWTDETPARYRKARVSPGGIVARIRATIDAHSGRRMTPQDALRCASPGIRAALLLPC
jgi:AraC-like DNA-binding protein